MKNQRQALPPAGADRMKVLAALMASAFAVAAHAAAPQAWVATTTKAHDPRSAVHVAPLRAGEKVDVVVSLKLRNKGELDALAARLRAGAPGTHALSAAEFMAKYAPTAGQAEAVVAYLRTQGFTNIKVAPNHLLVSATGTAGAIRAAFKADLHEYDVDGRRAFANVTDAMIPAQLSDAVLGVVGLQTVHLMHTQARRMAHPGAASTQAAGGVSLTDFSAIYGASSLGGSDFTSIGIITAGDVTQTIADLKAFAASAGFPEPIVETRVIGTPSTGTSGTDEWNMDSQAALAAAGGTIMGMVLYNVPDLSDASLTMAYNQVLEDRSPISIDVSLGACETDEVSIEPTQDAIFESAFTQGQMFSVASGDSGAYECGGTSTAQSYPAVSPYVMAVGGTTLSSVGGTWQGETVWSCTSASSCQQSSSGGAGGGPSLTENAPSWQIAAGVLGASTMRGVPDISFDAAPSSGALVLVNGQQVQIGGTSLAAPLWAGFWARIQTAHGNAMPYPAQPMYEGGATHPEWFHDVTSGNQGYPAGPGWDYATGWGSVQVANFSNAFTVQPPPAPPPTPAPPPPLPPPPPAPTPSNPILNGGFEGSAAPWAVSSGVWCTNSTCKGESAKSGTGFLWLDGYGAVHTDTASQTFKLTAGPSATLVFYLHVDTKQKASAGARDKLTVSIASGGSTKTLATYSNLDAAPGYVQRKIDLSAYAGKTLTLKFTGTENGSAQTSFVMDNVAVVF